MTITEFFQWGGIEAMSTISFIGISMIILLVIHIFGISFGKLTKEKCLKGANELAILSLVMGIFFQLIGLFGAFEAIEAAGSVPMGLLAGGLKVSSISTLYGIFYFIIGKVAIIIIRLNSNEA